MDISMGADTMSFSEQYYHLKAWENNRWLGHRVLKPPTDMMVQQEIIYETEPDFIIETGTFEGGSALFYSDVLRLCNPAGQVITIDIHRKHPIQSIKNTSVLCIKGDSTSLAVTDKVSQYIADNSLNTNNPRVMVVLDSNHTKKHVLKELYLYSPLVTKGCYLIVEDTIISPRVQPKLYPGPAHAIEEFLSCPENKDKFVVDTSREKHGLSFHSGGYLLRVS